MVDNTTPLLLYFKSGNIFSGSDRRKRYKIWPNKETGEMLIKIWLGDYCLESTPPEEVEENTFPITEEGRTAMIRWINEWNGIQK